MSRDTGKRSVWVNRVFTHLQAGQDVESSSPIQNEKDRRLQSLHNELKVIHSQASTRKIFLEFIVSRCLVHWK